MIDVLTMPVGDLPLWQFLMVCFIGVILIWWKGK